MPPPDNDKDGALSTVRQHSPGGVKVSRLAPGNQ